MNLDLYTKVVLTVIALGVLVSINNSSTITKSANATSGSGTEMIATSGEGSSVFHLKNGKIRHCNRVKCTRFQ